MKSSCSIQERVAAAEFDVSSQSVGVVGCLIAFRGGSRSIEEGSCPVQAADRKSRTVQVKQHVAQRQQVLGG